MIDSQDRLEQKNKIIGILLDELDISETKYREAESRYKAVGDWLDRDESSVSQYHPEVYVQGSFRLGTVIRPISEDGEYDIDSVCKLDLNTKQCSQEELKLMIGDEIKAYAKEQAMKKPVKEGKRCWTLNYADGSRFHMDVLPAIPHSEGFRILLESKKASSEWGNNTIAITDNTLPNYRNRNTDWPISNPKDYADWFRAQMKVSMSRNFARSAILMEKFASVEEVPTYRFKTPLQRVVQILKYHRDNMFGDDDEKPISVIITTLAAHAYTNEDNVLVALQNIVPRMRAFIEEREGVRWIANPVNPLENFADKWPRHPAREIKFFEWYNAVAQCVANIASPTAGLESINEGLVKIAGVDVAKSVMRHYGGTVHEARDSGSLKASKGAATLGVVGTTVKKHTFYGK